MFLPHNFLLLRCQTGHSNQRPSGCRETRRWLARRPLPQRFGLLKSGTVLAHVAHAATGDLERMAGIGVGVAHCPLSNAYFANAMFPTLRALDLGVPVGLGSDIAGGPSPSLLLQCHQAVTSSRMLEDGADPTRLTAERGVPLSRIDIQAAFWMATVGGARILDLPAGLIEAGYRFDAIAVDTTSTAGPVRVWEVLDTPESVFEKVVRLAGPTGRSAQCGWTAGRLSTEQRRTRRQPVSTDRVGLSTGTSRAQSDCNSPWPPRWPAARARFSAGDRGAALAGNRIDDRGHDLQRGGLDYALIRHAYFRDVGKAEEVQCVQRVEGDAATQVIDQNAFDCVKGRGQRFEGLFGKEPGYG
ncbi:MAG: hypothetical protein CL466_11665 [Acidimicrobiaceae bacterium]|nr:hypothetical protein [Acidimicrobiaceae bacterium]